MLFTSLTPEMLKTHFSRIKYHQGNDYYLQKRVQQLAVNTDRRGDTITALVQGSRSQPYRVQIQIKGSQQRLTMRDTCSCPLATHCKHIVATLLAALHDPPKVMANAPKAPIPPPPPQPALDSSIAQWLQRLDRTIAQGKNPLAVDESYSLFYMLKTAAYDPTELSVELCLIKRLKSGALGTPRKFSPTADSSQRHLYPADQELLVQLEAARRHARQTAYYADRFPLQKNYGEKLLTAILATGRCHWLSPTHPPLCLAPAKTARFDWQSDESGCQTVRLIQPEGCDQVVSIDQLWYVDKNQSQLGVLETGLDPQVARLLLSAPKIPPTQAKVVADWWQAQTLLSPMSQPKTFITSAPEKIKPTPCLRLFPKSIQSPGDYKNHWQPVSATQPLAALSFRYRRQTVAWEKPGDTLHQIENQQLTPLIRDKQREQQAFNTLIDHDLLPINQHPDLARLNSACGSYFLVGHDRRDPLKFSLEALPRLRAQGWEIEIADDYPYRVIDAPLEDWYSDIEEDRGYEWFSLELGIILNGEKINLLPILQQLIQQSGGNSAALLNASAPIPVRLADGRFLALPADRVRHILNILIELYDSDSLTDEQRLRLSNLQALRLLELEAAMDSAQLRWFGGERLRRQAAKIADFKGIVPVKAPPEFQGELRPYQQEGLSWLQFLREYEWAGILADDMGLGKTVQALAHLTVEKVSGRMKNPSLVIAPTSLMFNWRCEAEQFSPELKVLVLHGAERKNQFEQMAQFDLVLTTYPLLIRDKEQLLKQDFHLLILDEAQFIKNAKSLATQIVQQIRANHRLCLTGTPLENHLGELWSLFHFMMPGLLGDAKQFQRLFRKPIEKEGNDERRQHLARRIAPFLLRRTKDKVVRELPDKVEMIRHVELSGAQRDLYETIRMTMQEKLRREIARLGLARSHIIILDALLKLRQVCCDPRLLKMKTTRRQQAASAKLELLMTLLPELLEEGRRILLFSQFTGMLALIEDELNQRGIPYLILTGQTKDRATPVRRFQQNEAPLFLISLKAGGTGLNLTAADTVIHYDPWWNPAVENQATDRAHRIGQSKTVFVYKLVAKGTVEEKILQMQQNKRALMDGLFSNPAAGKLPLSEKDLQSLFEPLV